jgi:hypothetical protein
LQQPVAIAASVKIGSTDPNPHAIAKDAMPIAMIVVAVATANVPIVVIASKLTIMVVPSVASAGVVAA